MRIIVHFGMPKTGSTSIEKTLYKGRDKLTNLAYPNFGTHAHNIFLCQTFREIMASPAAGTIAFEKNRYLAELKLRKLLEFNAHRDRDVLLSAELLTNIFNFNDLKALHSVLFEYTDNVVAVGYIRTPKAYIESAFQQRLKTGKVSSLELEQCFPYYQTFFEKFVHIFGADKVQFWKFDPASFQNGCVVTDFCQRLNIDITLVPIIRINDGISLEAVSLLYTYSKYRKELNLELPPDARLGYFINVPSLSEVKKLRFASKLVEPIMEKNRHHIEWMEKHMGVALAEDIAKDDGYAISSESQLLKFAPETTKWLANQLGVKYVNHWRADMSPQEVAKWMHLLRLRSVNKKLVARKSKYKQASPSISGEKDSN